MVSSSPANLFTNLSVKNTAAGTLTIDNFKNNDDHHVLFQPLGDLSLKANDSLHINLYPRGIFKQHRDHLFITVQNPAGLFGKLLVYIEDVKGEKAEPLECTVNFTRNNNYYCFTYLSRQDILDQTDRLLQAGSLTVNFEFSILDNSKKLLLESLPSLSTDYQVLLEKGTFSDVLLQVAGQEFKAHKAVLAARSPVFLAMFENDLKESREGVVDLEDVEVKSFEAFLRYLYTDQVENLKEIAKELIALADRYQVDSLKTVCGVYLSHEITVDSFTRLLLLSHMHQVDPLKAECFKYFESHVKEIVATKDWDTFLAENTELLPILFKIMTLKK